MSVLQLLSEIVKCVRQEVVVGFRQVAPFNGNQLLQLPSLTVGLSHRLVAADECPHVFAVEAADVADGDRGRTGGFAFARVRAVAETFFVHLCDHFQDTTRTFRLALRKQREL